MSDPHLDATPSGDEAKPEQLGDDLLASLVGIMNNLNADPAMVASLGVVLVVGGTVISGQLVGGGYWFGHVADKLESAPVTDTEAGSAVRTALAESLQAIRSDRYGPVSAGSGTIGYVHLVDARIFNQGNDPYFGPTSLRIRIEEVQAWDFGQALATGEAAAPLRPIPGPEPSETTSPPPPAT